MPADDSLGINFLVGFPIDDLKAVRVAEQLVVAAGNLPASELEHKGYFDLAGCLEQAAHWLCVAVRRMEPSPELLRGVRHDPNHLWVRLDRTLRLEETIEP